MNSAAAAWMVNCLLRVEESVQELIEFAEGSNVDEVADGQTPAIEISRSCRTECLS